MSTPKTFTIGTRNDDFDPNESRMFLNALQVSNIINYLGRTKGPNQSLRLKGALENKTVDLVVHSLKDLPTTLSKGMTIGAILKREDPNDAVIIKEGLTTKSLEELPKGSIVGTSSVRRISQLKNSFPDLIFQNIRGNLDTRLAKLDNPDGQYSAIILAVAGLVRLGALAIECRDDDKDIIELLSVLEDTDTKLRCTAERSLLMALEGGCGVPIGVNTSFVEENEGKRMLRLESLVAQLDGSKIIRAEVTKYIDGIDTANELGKVSKILIERGARNIIEELKH
ncbi:21470_t:CDS:2 [Dentiscutata erythropus]|uniref:hydroxymethylbilane synthase n=1 Tax=Dentiscutata erythropus TaxID=1348616 RepID=A0A9N9CWA4_9GLOM|nr:21470_t:CDS:2 [Dentiscutata erythropus]